MSFNCHAAVNHFVEALVNLPDHHPLDDALASALIIEDKLRSSSGPPRNFLSAGGPYSGLINVFSVDQAARRTRARRFEAGTTEIYDHYVFPLREAQRRLNSTPSTVCDLEMFHQHWDIFTYGSLSKMKPHDWDNVVAAGSSVLASLMVPPSGIKSSTDLKNYFQSPAYASSDINLFFWGLSDDQAKHKAVAVYQAVCAAVPWHATCVREAHMVSIYTQWPHRAIRILFKIYHSPAEILAGFDVDAACCAYDGKQVWVNPRALTALVRQANTVDAIWLSPAYETRLACYAARGFEVYVPFLNRDLVDPAIYGRDLAVPSSGLGRLLSLEAAYHNPDLYKGAEYRRHPPSDLGDSILDEMVKTPQGKYWSAQRIEEIVRAKDSWLNSPYNKENSHFGVDCYHRHESFAGTMGQCLGYFCLVCAIIEDMVGPSGFPKCPKFIKGPAEFATEGLFNDLLLDEGFREQAFHDWASDAYDDGMELMTADAPDSDELV